jgi:hypothetical protein
MPTTIDHQSASLDEVRRHLHEAAENLPEPNMPDSHAWGISAAAALVDKGSPSVLQAAGEVLGEFLRDGSPAQAHLAASVNPEKLVDPLTLRRALDRDDLDDLAVARLRGAVGRAITQGRLGWDPPLRDHLAESGSEPLVAAALIHDHVWFLSHLTDVLGTDPKRAGNRLWFGVIELRRAEAERLQDELRARESALGVPYVTELLEVIVEEADDGRFDGRDGPIRW